MIYDGNDVQYLLKKKGYSLTDVAREIEVTPQIIFLVITGQRKSRRILQYIEKLLGMAPETLEISREKRDAIVKVA